MRHNARICRVLDIRAVDRDGSLRELFSLVDRETRQAVLVEMFEKLPNMPEGWYGGCDALVAEIDEKELLQEFGTEAGFLLSSLLKRVSSD